MKRLAIIVVLGVVVTWSAIHWDQLNRSMDSAFTYASDNPGTFWAAGGILAVILAVSLLRTR